MRKIVRAFPNKWNLLVSCISWSHAYNFGINATAHTLAHSQKLITFHFVGSVCQFQTLQILWRADNIIDFPESHSTPLPSLCIVLHVCVYFFFSTIAGFSSMMRRARAQYIFCWELQYHSPFTGTIFSLCRFSLAFSVPRICVLRTLYSRQYFSSRLDYGFDIALPSCCCWFLQW